MLILYTIFETNRYKDKDDDDDDDDDVGDDDESEIVVECVSPTDMKNVGHRLFPIVTLSYTDFGVRYSHEYKNTFVVFDLICCGKFINIYDILYICPLPISTIITPISCLRRIMNRKRSLTLVISAVVWAVCGRPQPCREPTMPLLSFFSDKCF